MYRHICVPVDNSDWSNKAIDLAVELGKAFGSTLVGSHVYAARLHDYRFKQMEYTLPEEYKDETELERQRKIHDSLIAMGLQLISDSYLDVMGRKAEAAGLGFERKLMAKARVEKYARSRKIPVITRELAFPLIEETVGRDKLGAGWETLIANTRFEPAAVEEVAPEAGAFTWTPDAVARLNRVPAGFMRDMTREEIERVARDKGATTIDLTLCEEGIGHARTTMNEVIAGYIGKNKLSWDQIG